ncbi:MBL fold metallo-hydrolase [[Clostridium] polysaccharolyticum]|uniref:7,8-dihydropterin-6-yl-methyl-4-(Beta-D-ribofuranosyl)aminobenzene 5'-phosphate synthase n=1 Tax=[Clostridium] polysaccharolyticum TaxID=29364 RepID=A0A1I0DFH6_9FIRM|nr:MBL fold metallo-hydrolase [[Clostridium] polysaccharolyticum]SET30826.1 7,8-dihydropterin-6-yl-methyl-4-(beta-D-ribofuranosyl)aminobenzene 5'-phosphate synthase [[Clostridium] polysaccharolyticum]
MSITITTLIENTPSTTIPLLNYEHGLSLYIQTAHATILFDTGQSGDFIQNADKLNKDLKAVDYLILSHGHYDHGGGVCKLLEQKVLNPKCKLLTGAEFFTPKYKITEDGECKFIGNAFDEEEIQAAGIHLVKITQDTVALTPNVLIFHHFRQFNHFEELNPKFILKKAANHVIDSFQDEMAIGIKTAKGLVLIVGCSHIGIVNILEDVSKRVDMPIYMVIGGTHLVAADEERVQKTIEAFRQFGVEKIAVSHCTGEYAAGKLKESFPKGFVKNNTGNIIFL